MTLAWLEIPMMFLNIVIYTTNFFIIQFFYNMGFIKSCNGIKYSFECTRIIIMKRVLTLNTTIKKLKDSNPSQESFEINLGSQAYIDDENAELLQNAIEHCKRKTLRFSRITFSPWIGQTIFNACIANPVIKSIEFPIWSIINSPGQRPLMEMEDDLPLIVEAYNEECKKDLVAFEYFKMLNDRVFKITSVKKVDAEDVEAEVSQCFLDPKLIQDHIGSFIARTRKTVTL
jgi:hypothetical protein